MEALGEVMTTLSEKIAELERSPTAENQHILENLKKLQDRELKHPEHAANNQKVVDAIENPTPENIEWLKTMLDSVIFQINVSVVPRH
jgi:hypothetical protein